VVERVWSVSTLSPSKPTLSAPPSWKRRLFRIVRLFVLCYLGIILVLWLLESKLVYYPCKASTDWEAPPTPDIKDVELTSADGTAIHAWWLPSPGAKGALLYCHGNAGNLSHRGVSIARLRDKLGESVLIFDYPGYGKSAGSPTEQGCYDAAEAAYNWLVERQQIDPEQIIVYGGSLGGGVALDLASRKPHRAVVLINTFTSLPDVGASIYPWLPVRWLMRNRYDNLGKICKCGKPIFIAHAQNDDLIPFALGEKLYQACPSPKCFFPMPGGDHNSRLPDDFYPTLKAFLEGEGK
jgi:fermentation-respiration switch protein FrsA (DUF1100 family)